MGKTFTIESANPFYATAQWTSDSEANDAISNSIQTEATAVDCHAKKYESVKEQSNDCSTIETISDKVAVGESSPNDSGLGTQVESLRYGKRRRAAIRASRAHINAERMRARALYHVKSAEEMAACDGERFVKKEKTPPPELNLDFSDWDAASSPSASSSTTTETPAVVIKCEPQQPSVDYSSDRSFASRVNVSFNSSATSSQEAAGASLYSRSSQMPTGANNSVPLSSPLYHRRSMLPTRYDANRRQRRLLAVGGGSGETPVPLKSPRFHDYDTVDDEFGRLSPTEMASLPRSPKPTASQPSTFRCDPDASRLPLLSIKEEQEEEEEEPAPASIVPVVVKQECVLPPIDYKVIKKVRVHKRADYEADRAAENSVVLKSCLKTALNTGSLSTQQPRRVEYAFDRTTTAMFQIAEGNTMLPLREEKVDCVQLTQKYTRIARKRAHIFKKTDTRAMRMSISGELAALLKRVRTASNIYSRWLIADGVLRDLNDAIFKNMVVTRLDYPMNSSWLLTYGLKDVEFDFEVSYIFVACGAERFEYDSPSHLNGFEPTGLFLREMHTWISARLALRKVERERKVRVQCDDGEDMVDMAYSHGIPVLVAITVPEDGETVALRREFNKRLRQFVQEFNTNELPKLQSDGIIALPIELLDWAKSLSGGDKQPHTPIAEPSVQVKSEVIEDTDEKSLAEKKDRPVLSATERRQQSEKRFEKLTNDFCHSYGVLIR